MSDLIKNLTKQDFDSTVNAPGSPLLVDFWAPWCGPCRAIAPILEELAQEMAGRVAICKVDVEENPELATRFDVKAIPTLLVFKNGQVANRIVGMVNKQALKSKLEPALV